MEYVIIGACIVVAIAGGIVLYVKNKRTKNELGNTAVVVSKTSSSKLQASEVANDPVIQIGILPADAISDETKLVEITDSKVLAHINNLVDERSKATIADEMRGLTDIDNPNSVSQMKSWLSDQGIEVESLGKKAIAEMIKDAPEDLAQVLSLRQQLAKSSVKKYQARPL